MRKRSLRVWHRFSKTRTVIGRECETLNERNPGSERKKRNYWCSKSGRRNLFCLCFQAFWRQQWFKKKKKCFLINWFFYFFYAASLEYFDRFHSAIFVILILFRKGEGGERACRYEPPIPKIIFLLPSKIK